MFLFYRLILLTEENLKALGVESLGHRIELMVTLIHCNLAFLTVALWRTNPWKTHGANHLLPLGISVATADTVRQHDRPFPSYSLPLFQNESKCKILNMKMSLISF